MRDRGVVRIHDGALAAALTTHDGLPSDDIRALRATRDGSMWIGTSEGLARWKPRTVPCARILPWRAVSATKE
jgi:ligand-binding sensor domain-containing protein